MEFETGLFQAWKSFEMSQVLENIHPVYYALFLVFDLVNNINNKGHFPKLKHVGYNITQHMYFSEQTA